MRSGGRQKIKKKVCVIQARSASTRLKGKIFFPLCGKPMLWHLIERVKRCKLIEQIVVAMPLHDESYRSIYKVTDECGINLFPYRGKTADLGSRHLAAAKKFDADTIIRIPGDNPLIESSEVDRIIEYQGHGTTNKFKFLYSNIQNIHDSGYPDGIGAEVYSMELLKWIDDNAKDKEHREHPRKSRYEKDMVKTIPCPDDIKRPDLRLDVNIQKDYEFILSIYEALYPGNYEFGIRDIIAFLDKVKSDKALAAKLSAKPFYKENVLNELFNKVIKK